MLAGSGQAAAEEPFRPRGLHNDAVHRYFPDLNARFNAVRYGRWRALEIAWISGINPDLDREFSSYLLSLLADPPRYPPEANLVAPRFARGASAVYHALHWGQVLEQQLSDALAAPDAMPELTRQRLARAVAAYRREAHALRDPAQDAAAAEKEGAIPSEAARFAPVSAKILASGTALFIRAAESLAGTDFGEQRWRVMDTITQFDRTFAGDFGQAKATTAEAGQTEAPPTADPGVLSIIGYRSAAPAVVALSPEIAADLDRLSRFRVEVFEALIPGGATPAVRRERDARLRVVAGRYGLPEQEIGEE
jgi:hypothetical protein